MSNSVITSRLCHFAGYNSSVALTIDDVAYLVQRLRTANAVEIESMRMSHMSKFIGHEGGKHLQAAEFIQRVSLKIWGTI